VLSADCAWPVPDSDGAEAYELSIRALLADPEAARRRAGELRERLLDERDPKEFARHVTELLLRDTREQDPVRTEA
jgi:hypothetical protein